MPPVPRTQPISALKYQSIPSVVNVTALVALDENDLGTEAGQLPPALMNDVDRGLRRVLGL